MTRNRFDEEIACLRGSGHFLESDARAGREFLKCSLFSDE
jgi:hypothetical protein